MSLYLGTFVGVVLCLSGPERDPAAAAAAGDKLAMERVSCSRIGAARIGDADNGFGF
jgi:hypothetical protein